MAKQKTGRKAEGEQPAPQTPETAGSNTGTEPSQSGPSVEGLLGGDLPGIVRAFLDAPHEYDTRPEAVDKTARETGGDGLAEIARQYAGVLSEPEYPEMPAMEVHDTIPASYRWTSAEDLAADLGPLLALARVEEWAPILRAEVPEMTTYSRPRMGLRPGDVRPLPGEAAALAGWQKRKQKAERNGGTVYHQCGLTRVGFWLPFGAPVPFVAWDTFCPAEAEDEHRRSELSLTLHPALLAAGPEAVARAVWGRASALRWELENAMRRLLSAVSVARSVPGAEAIEVLPPGSAFTKGDGTPGAWYRA